MDKLIQRISSFFATPLQAQDKISDLLIELRGRGINFDLKLIDEDGIKYYYASSADYPRGSIIATGASPEELESELKNAIFSAFEVPSGYSNPDLINFNPPLSQPSVAQAKVVHAST